MSGRSGASAQGSVVRAAERCVVRRLRRLLLLLGLLAIGLAGTVPRTAAANEDADSKTSGIRIAIAPFVGEGEGSAISSSLATRFTRFGVDRLLAPGSFVAEREFDPRAELVRTWAYQAAVDTIVVGRVEQPYAHSDAQQIEAVVRSGHSGAELFRHAVQVPARAALGSALDQLASAIVRDLGGDPVAAADPEADSPTPAVSANAESPADPSVPPAAAASQSTTPTTPTTPTAPVEPVATVSAPAQSGAAGSGKVAVKADKTAKGTAAPGGVEGRLGVGAFKSDAPIEIHADEAEIQAQGVNRKLVFKGGVQVHQDNVSLGSDLLEAEYEEGASEPSKLVAHGAVHVEQGNRSARCDQAEYLRTTQKITCRGHAELVQGCDVVRGELIVLDLSGEKARVEGAASIVISPKQNGDVSCSVPGRKP